MTARFYYRLSGVRGRLLSRGPELGRASLSISLDALLSRLPPRVIKRVHSLDQSINNMNSVENVVHAVDGFHIEDSRDKISLDNMLLHSNALNGREHSCQKSKYRLPARQLWHSRSFKRYIFRKGDFGQILGRKTTQICFDRRYFLFS
jgi:hypothetical protein